MDARPAILEWPAPVEQRIGADEAVRRPQGFSTVTWATCWRRVCLNSYTLEGHKEMCNELAK
jgi:hypothetical protein